MSEKTYEHKRLGEYAGAAIRDMKRYRDALYRIEQRADVPPQAKLIARKALRQYTDKIGGDTG